ncbi:hypothetical protein PFTANZ_04948, partial [Plasmodium falciparum Tanzania (2000708)]
MAPQGPRVGGTQDGAEKYKNAQDAKHLFDLIGQTVHSKVHDAAKQYVSELKGDLKEAKFEGKKISGSPPCNLDYTKLTNVTIGGGREYPCRNGTKERFLNTQGAECDYRKIRDSDKKNNSVGACAPLRRLHLCDKNLENISDYNNINNHTLLVDVCLAAQHEGQSINTHYQKYQAQYASSVSPSQICTMLARSFADIGDI